MSLQPRYLLDTNICIDLMKRSAACRIGEVLISAITAAELHYGVVASGEEAEHNRAALARQPASMDPYDWPAVNDVVMPSTNCSPPMRYRLVSSSRPTTQGI